MKYEIAGIKATMAGMAIAVAGSTQAQTLQLDTLATNTGDFVFSSTLLSGNSLAGITLSAVSPATLDSGGGGATSTVTGVTLDANNVITVAASTGGTLQTASSAKFLITNGGSLSVTNLTYHAATNQLFGDLSGANGVAAQTQVAIFNVTTVTVDGVTVNPLTSAITAGTHTIVDSGLFLANSTIVSYFKTALGLYNLGASTLDSINNPSNTPEGFGTLTSTLTFTPSPVPETSTYLSFAAGLCGLATLSWRRRASVSRR